MKLSTCLFALAGLIAPSILSAQPADTTRAGSEYSSTTRSDTSALPDESVTGEALRRRSRSNLVLAMRWLCGVTESEEGRLGYRNRLLGSESVLVDGMTFGDRFTPVAIGTLAGFESAMFTPTPSLMSIASATLRSNAGVTRAGSGDGLVDIVMRHGSREGFTGGAFVRSDFAPLFGSSGEIGAHIPGESRDTTLAPVKAAAAADRLYELFVEGPIPGVPATVHVSAKYNRIGYLGATYDLLDAPATFFDARRDSAARAGHATLEPTNLGRLPRASAMAWDLYGNVVIEPSDAISIVVSAETGTARRDIGDPITLYMLDRPTFSAPAPGLTQIGDSAWADLTVLERDAQSLSSNVDVSRVHASLRIELDDRSTIGLDVLRSSMDEAVGKRMVRSYGALEGYEIYGPVDADRNVVLDRYEDRSRQTVLNQYLPVTARSVIRARNATTGLFEGGYDGVAISPFGDAFTAHGNARGLTMRETDESRARLTWSSSDSLFGLGAAIDAGLEGSWFTLRKYENSLPWTSNPFFDIYGYRSTILSADSSTSGLEKIFAAPHEPFAAAAFVRLRWALDELSCTTGLRLETFDAKAVVLAAGDRSSWSRVLTAFENPTESTTKLELLPELVLAYRPARIGELSIGFSTWTTRPTFTALYDGAYLQTSRGVSLVGDPDLAPARTKRFELRGALIVSDRARVTAGAYSELSVGVTGVSFRSSIVSPFVQYDDANQVDRIGGELGVVAELAEHVMLTAGWHVGRASTRDPSEQAADDGALPASVDRTHAVNATLDIAYGRGEGPTLGGIHFLSNTTLFFGAGYRSGRPRFASTSSGSTSVLEPWRLPDRWISVASLSREIPLADIFGESLGAAALELSIDVENLLNRTDAIDSYTNRYGMEVSPTNDDGSMDQQIGDFPATQFFRDIDPSRPETYSQAQYDRYGARLYNTYIDSNLDGVVTQTEKYAGYQRWIATLQSLRENFQFPRQVFLRPGLRF